MDNESPQQFDVIIIGGGPAGTTAAKAAAVFGRTVALIEKEPRLGGAGINSGTIPSKTLRETALALSGWRSRELFGVDLSLRRGATIQDFMYHSHRVTNHERDRLESLLDHFGVQTFVGTAAFIDPHTVSVTTGGITSTSLTAGIIIIATGSSPTRPPEFQFEDDRIHDSDELLHITRLPEKLVVIGAGVIGSEYASTFAALGVEVHLVDGRSELLPFLDSEISAALHRAMARTMRFHWNERVTHCDNSHPEHVILTLTSGATISCDGVLICAGRSSRIDQLNLAAAGITPGERGTIAVTPVFQTTQVPHIYAVGDVIGPPALAATGMEQARTAICHALGSHLKTGTASLLPTGIYTIPEVSMAGESEESLKEKGIHYIAGRSRYGDHPRGRIIGDDEGFLKLLFQADDMKLLGVHVMGEHATEIIHIGLMTMMLGGTAQAFSDACFNYPTLGDLYKMATFDAMLHKENRHPGYPDCP